MARQNFGPDDHTQTSDTGLSSKLVGLNHRKPEASSFDTQEPELPACRSQHIAGCGEDRSGRSVSNNLPSTLVQTHL